MTHDRVVVIGASTGGPQTLEAVLSSLPSNFPFPIIVAQHVPGVFFSQSLAKRLDGRCHLDVKVAEDGEVIHGGEVYLVPFGFSMEVRETKNEGRRMKDEKTSLAFHLSSIVHRPSSIVVSPSVDETMSSLAKTYHKNILGIILTGIGHDGVDGMRAIKQRGGHTIAQDESALINGMPSAVIEAGLADEVLSLEEVSRAIVEFAEKNG